MTMYPRGSLICCFLVSMQALAMEKVVEQNSDLQVELFARAFRTLRISASHLDNVTLEKRRNEKQPKAQSQSETTPPPETPLSPRPQPQTKHTALILVGIGLTVVIASMFGIVCCCSRASTIAAAGALQTKFLPESNANGFPSVPNTTSSVNGEADTSRPRRSTDAGFLVVWLIQLSIVLINSILPLMDCLTGSDCVYSSIPFHPGIKPGTLLAPMTTSATVAVVLCALEVISLQQFARSLLECILCTLIILQMAIACWWFGITVAVMVSLFVAAFLTAVYLFFVRNRMHFAAAHLQAACHANSTNPSAFVLSFGMFFLQVLWALVWWASFICIKAQYLGLLGMVMQLAMLWSLLWTLEIIQGVCHYSTCGMVGSWWFSRPARRSPTFLAFRRACTTSLGSICFGALLVSALTFIRIVLKRCRQCHGQTRATWLVTQLEKAAMYFNSYAIAIVSLQGKDFTTAGKEVSSLFAQRGWTALLNDLIVSRILAVFCIGVACITGFVGGAMCAAQEQTPTWKSSVANKDVRTSATFGFILGLWMAQTLNGVIASAVRTIFVCFALDPAALAQTHPNEFMQICEGWESCQPIVFQACGYEEVYAVQKRAIANKMA